MEIRFGPVQVAVGWEGTTELSLRNGSNLILERVESGTRIFELGGKVAVYADFDEGILVPSSLDPKTPLCELVYAERSDMLGGRHSFTCACGSRRINYRDFSLVEVGLLSGKAALTVVQRNGWSIRLSRVEQSFK